MKKITHVVYNDCEGEFSLSRESLKWLAERGVTMSYKLLEEIGNQEKLWPIDEAAVGMERHSALLVLCVSELGSKVASGERSHLRVAKIDSRKYMIRNTAGIETVLTPKDIIWVEVD